MIKIALAGNPNSGKTTIFNNLTGSSQYVGNWPGVTVEKKEGTYKKDITIVDLPGAYSLSPYTLEEVVARDYLINDPPGAIINIVDATNIERNLYLTTQLMEIGIPIIIALNMYDIVNKNGDKIDVKKLENSLGVKVFATSALKGQGLKEAVNKAVDVSKKPGAPIAKIFPEKINGAIKQISALIKGHVPNKLNYWYAVKFFERDQNALSTIKLPNNIIEEIEPIIQKIETEMDDTSESLITFERYEYIEGIVKQSVVKNNNSTTSEKIDLVLTNRFLALPIFALIMWFVYFISVSSIGAMATDWANEELFGNIIGGNISKFFISANVSPVLHSLVVDGLIGGVGSVLGFVPQIMILFFLLSILEDCGYMARVAFIMDRVFRKFGLSGKSFIPMLISSGCGVPGIMASRTIESEKDRRMTIILTTFIPCGAKLPIIALIASSMFRGSSLVAPSMYFLGIGAVVLSGLILKKTKAFQGNESPFVMELPQYHAPSIKNILNHTWERGKSFIIKAGTVIFIACGFIWFLSNFNFSLELVPPTESILSTIGTIIAPIFMPLGFGEWQPAVASLTGLLAKENVVSTLSIFYGLGESASADAGLIAAISSNFNIISAVSFMSFNLLCAPCVAAIAAVKREMGTWRWTFIAVGYQTLFAYCISFLINNLGGVIFLSAPITVMTYIALFMLGGIVWLTARKDSYLDKKYRYKYTM
ncbi:MAG: ferrous iron transport protein B [Clostridiales bacterium]|jgi:ferrous iron transport protein B|nr:ferrous iron transport protein B [Clostridiales bacterium]